jgi:hypothetical protein
LSHGLEKKSSVFDLSAVRDNQVDAKSLDRSSAVHFGRERKRVALVDRVPPFADEVQDFASLVSLARFRHFVQ